MESEMIKALRDLSQENHIDELYLLDRLEQTLAKSYAELLHLEYGAKVTIDKSTGKIYVYKLVPVGEPDEETGEYSEFSEVDITPSDTSRMAAMHAKSEIKAIIKHAAKKDIYEEFKDKIGDLVTGTVLQSTPDFTNIKIREGVEAELPHFDGTRKKEGEITERNERPAGEHYSHGQRIKAIIIEVRDPDNANVSRSDSMRPTIVVSRSHPDLLKRLLELEVPEIYDGVIEVKSVAREAGMRSKVAVQSFKDRLDPVGACVGPKGARIRSIVAELRGERVDVVEWSEDPAERIANALSPAVITKVLVDPDPEHTYATVIVPDDQLSLAIGKEGQNARLAARLTGYHIDIKNETLAHDIIEKIKAQEEQEQLNLIDSEDEGEHRCAYVSEDGVQCRNAARPGSIYCGVHDENVKEDNEDDNTISLI